MLRTSPNADNATNGYSSIVNLCSLFEWHYLKILLLSEASQRFALPDQRVGEVVA